MAKRIGILTRHCYPNYGSILQAYSLQTTLSELGAHARIVDYVSPNDTAFGLVKANLRISPMNKRWWTRCIYAAIQTPTFFSMCTTFRAHQRRLLKLTRTVRDKSELQSISSEFDLMVVGSDQVWNRITDSIDSNYLLSFMGDRSKKASYAASMGASEPLAVDQAPLLSAVREFSHVSVREPSSQNWLQSMGIESRSDIDPVFLQNKQFWNDFAGPRRRKGKYILVYQLHNTNNFKKRIQEIKDRHNIPVIKVTPDWKRVSIGQITKVLASPEEFVALIRDATYVVTDSFHGTAFSLLQGTPLYVVPPGKYSTRLTDMVARAGLERIIVPSISSEPLPHSVDYDADVVSKALSNYSSSSLEYLKRIAA